MTLLSHTFHLTWTKMNLIKWFIKMGQRYLGLICLVIYNVNAYVPMGYLGCYEDKFDRILDIKLKNSDSNSGGECKLRCSSREYRYAGTENQEECYCGFHLKNYPMRSGCNLTCPGYEKEYCGGHMRISIYDTWQCARKPCKNNATCLDLSKETYICNCTDGWEGKYCDQESFTYSAIAKTTIPSTFAKSTFEREQITSSTLGLDGDTGNNLSLVVAYVLAPVGCLVVFVSVLVIVIWKRRKWKNKEERPINDMHNHMYSDVDTTLASLKTTSLESMTRSRQKLPPPETNRQVTEEHGVNCVLFNGNQKPYDNITDGFNERPEDAMYITPIYTLENEYTYIDPVSVYSQINMDGQYEMLRRNNLCENEYKTLHVNKVNPPYDDSKQL